MRTRTRLAALLSTLAVASSAAARPEAPEIVRATYPAAPISYAGPAPCTLCHTTTPARNAYGDAVYEALSKLAPPPFEAADFETHLAGALQAIELEDADADSVSNIDEIEAGSWPGEKNSTPTEATCPSPEELEGFEYQICQFDAPYAYRRVRLDFCGSAPSFEELTMFRALGLEAQKAEMIASLHTCLASEFWRGPDGQLARLAHRKIRPVAALLGFADFSHDYNYFIYTQIEGHDAREALTGQYLVERKVEFGSQGQAMTSYVQVDELEGVPVEPSRRAGMITMPWNLFTNTMFTGIPRGTAAAVFRAFLGIDIAQSEGLEAFVDDPLIDYDGAGVTETGCIDCHRVLDRLAYPFSTYHGLTAPFYSYDANRIAVTFPEMAGVPEAGAIFGAPVKDLLEWAEVAASSDAFYIATTEDYWKLLVGEAPSPASPLYEEFVATWKTLRDDPRHSVEALLEVIIQTRAYAAP